ncbi:metallophosphoesterase [Lysinibacillus sp. ZYM-1]|uniref:metallophosphoesterase family protein n=1 Tax=Lysinibacillus sp. ZYM-1 TaxID=1681184 RepID=UPI0006CE9C2E|nr:metallophosphoesterase [Lysinibacillus sp. ZYM-1]KPN96239.1 hypothetical protein AO843_18185 [Lysinibacillus sp. ZYM-1]
MKKQTKRPLKIVDLPKEPIKKIPYRTAAPHGKGITYDWLPIFWGEVIGLPEELDALIVASDLQGVVEHDHRLLGEELADTCAQLFETHFSNLNPSKVLVCLCGDLYVNPLKRGSSGNSLPVWQAFQKQFGFVVGVAGNHDVLSDDAQAELSAMEGIHFFSTAENVMYSGLAIAGLGGIIGRVDKPNRMGEADYMGCLRQLLRQKPKLLVLHESPAIPAKVPGNPSIWNELQGASDLIVCCGHVHWETPLIECDNDLQVLNADGRAFIFTTTSLD